MPASSSLLQGPDVSSYQGRPDWSAVARAGRAFAWTKASEGTGYVNPTFNYNWPAMRSAGLVRGAYHFGRPDIGDSPEGEAQAFLSVVRGLSPGDLVALDLEAGSGNLLNWALRWLRYVEQRVGFKPMLYSGRWFLDPHGVEGNAELGQYPLWLAAYQQYTPALPPGWPALAMWQHTDATYIAGIVGPVDESYFFGSIQQLRSLGMPDPQAQPAPAPTVNDQLVTILSVIGDTTYPDGVNMDEAAPGQPVTRRVFTRQLVQHGKALLGA